MRVNSTFTEVISSLANCLNFSIDNEAKLVKRRNWFEQNLGMENSDTSEKFNC